jgi:hypothetical protein
MAMPLSAVLFNQERDRGKRIIKTLGERQTDESHRFGDRDDHTFGRV